MSVANYAFCQCSAQQTVANAQALDGPLMKVYSQIRLCRLKKVLKSMNPVGMHSVLASAHPWSTRMDYQTLDERSVLCYLS